NGDFLTALPADSGVCQASFVARSVSAYAVLTVCFGAGSPAARGPMAEVRRPFSASRPNRHSCGFPRMPAVIPGSGSGTELREPGTKKVQTFILSHQMCSRRRSLHV